MLPHRGKWKQLVPITAIRITGTGQKEHSDTISNLTGSVFPQDVTSEPCSTDAQCSVFPQDVTSGPSSTDARCSGDGKWNMKSKLKWKCHRVLIPFQMRPSLLMCEYGTDSRARPSKITASLAADRANQQTVSASGSSLFWFDVVTLTDRSGTSL